MKIKWDHMTQIEQDAYIQGFYDGKRYMLILLGMSVFICAFVLFILYVILP